MKEIERPEWANMLILSPSSGKLAFTRYQLIPVHFPNTRNLQLNGRVVPEMSKMLFNRMRVHNVLIKCQNEESGYKRPNCTKTFDRHEGSGLYEVHMGERKMEARIGSVEGGISVRRVGSTDRAETIFLESIDYLDTRLVCAVVVMVWMPLRWKYVAPMTRIRTTQTLHTSDTAKERDRTRAVLCVNVEFCRRYPEPTHTNTASLYAIHNLLLTHLSSTERNPMPYRAKPQKPRGMRSHGIPCKWQESTPFKCEYNQELLSQTTIDPPIGGFIGEVNGETLEVFKTIYNVE